MKQIIKNLMRNKGVTFLNVIGLSTAIFAFIVISMQVNYDVSYDKSNKHYDNLYQVGMKDTTDNTSVVSMPRYICDAIEDNYPSDGLGFSLSRAVNRFSILKDDEIEPIVLNEKILSISSGMVDILSIEIIDGDISHFDTPGSVIVSDKFALDHFKEVSPIGQVIRHLSGEEVEIVALFKSLPSNVSRRSELYDNIGDKGVENRTSFNNILIVKIDDKQKVADFSKYLNANMSLYGLDLSNLASNEFVLVPMCDMRSVMEGDNSSTILTMITAAFLILLLAMINFVNFSVSMVPLKVKGINIRKIMGAGQTTLRASLIGEAFVVIILSFIIAVLFVSVAKDSVINTVISDMSWEANSVVYILSLVISLVIGFVAGLYPAYYSTSFQPALALKSSYALSPIGRVMRKVLVGFQFFVSFIFIIVAIFVQIQHSYMVSIDGGYIKEGIIHVSHGANFDKTDILKAKLMQNPLVQDVTFSYSQFASKRSGSITTWMTNISTETGVEQVKMKLFPVADNFLTFFGVEILDGRGFVYSDSDRADGCLILGKSFAELYNYDLSSKVISPNGQSNVVGICEDVSLSNANSLKEPFVFYSSAQKPWSIYSHSYLKVSGDTKDIMKFIRDTYKEIDPDRYVDIAFLTTELENAYPEESKTKSIITGFSIIAIIIALVGVFGLVTFDTRFRRREIALRKVHGATISEILTMFGSAYIKILLVSFVVAAPVAWYVVNSWLQSFHYRIDIVWWVFALALFMVFLLTIVISTIQTYRAATENPIDVIKTQI